MRRVLNWAREVNWFTVGGLALMVLALASAFLVFLATTIVLVLGILGVSILAAYVGFALLQIGLRS